MPTFLFPSSIEYRALMPTATFRSPEMVLWPIELYPTHVLKFPVAELSIDLHPTAVFRRPVVLYFIDLCPTLVFSDPSLVLVPVVVF